MSSNLVSLDIETVCNVNGCPGFGGYKKCDHALSPWHGRITKIGVVDGVNKSVYDSVDHFNSNVGTGFNYLGHNFKFDLLWMRIHGAHITSDQWAHCTQLMAYVLTEKIPDSWLENYERERLGKGAASSIHRKAGKHSLKTLAPYFLGVEAFWEAEDKADDAYVLKDAEYTLRLSAVLAEKLKARGEWDFYLKLLEWTKMLLAAELRGIQIDTDALNIKQSELQEQEVELRKQIDRQWLNAHLEYRHIKQKELHDKYSAMAMRASGMPLAHNGRYGTLYHNACKKLPEKVELDSPKQMAWLLRDYLGYDIQSLEGDETTGREVLERLSDEGKEDVKVFLEWRKVNKLLTAFIPTYRDGAIDGTIHPVYNPTNTRTGRTSSERPNLQQVPPELRSLFRARTGYRFIGYDAAAIEAKLIALYTGDSGLHALISRGESLHNHNTKLFFGLDADANIQQDYPVHRQATKNVGFALFYGAGANRLRVTFAQKGFHLTDSQCQEILGRFKSQYRTAVEYHKSIARFFESGEKMQNLLGRPVKIDDPDEAYMKGLNSVIQGSASDLNLEGALRAWNELKLKGIDATPLLFVHDFVMFEVEDNRVDEADEIIVRNLTDFNLKTEHGPIKLTVDGGITERWTK